MLKSLLDSRPAAPIRPLFVSIVVALLAAFALVQPAMAIEMDALYSVEVPLDSEEDNPRQAAYELALRDVLNRVSGSMLAADVDLVDALFPNPSAWVVQYRPGTEADTLWVRFDGDAIEQVLRSNGQTVWGSDRPLTLVWLAVDWGQGDREIVGAQDSELLPDDSRTIDRDRLLRERVLEAAARRGLPVAFPLLDTEDMASISFADIWGGFDELVIAASERYGADSILIGRIRPESAQRNRWTFHFTEDQRTWSGEPELVMNLVGDALAAEYAVQGDAPLRTVGLSVSGVNTVADYGAVERVIADIAIVENARVQSISGDTVVYNVELRGGADRLARSLRLGGLIEQERVDTFDFDNPVGDLDSLEFFYSP